MATEKQAKEKWCPFVRCGSLSVAAHNRPDGSYNCIGSGCAVWEWQDRSDPDPEIHRGRCGLINRAEG